jgi:hypothetical protein
VKEFVVLNVEEIKQIVKVIEADPHHWNQRDWVISEAPFEEEKIRTIKINLDSIPHPETRDYFASRVDESGHLWTYDESCNTSNCVAGWAVLRAGLLVRNGYVFDEDGNFKGRASDVAQGLLGLNGIQASYIFAPGTGYDSRTEQYTPAELKRRITNNTGITFE